MSPRLRGVPAPVRTRRAWLVFALTAVGGTIAAALLPSPWSIVAGVLASLGAVGAFAMFVLITVLEDDERE
jgi:small-conductance mechanosensitive channel